MSKFFNSTKNNENIVKYQVEKPEEIKLEKSKKSKFSCFFFALLYGMFGGHRFYVGKTGSAILYLFTFGLLGIGVFLDIIKILNDKFEDVDGKLITEKEL